ncbi:glycoside hydrolase family 28 protein [Alistipes sp.]|uniref:glycoside hydrolase family 28 protein n=1 Tax=Alistipes sp. TaxID=1872444 RepID=UPI003AEFE205
MKRTAFILSAAALLSAGCGTAPDRYAALCAAQPFDMPALAAPEIPDRTLSVADCGGDATGRTLSTEAFARAVEQLSEQGGGRLVVPQGVWYTGPIVLESNIELHLEKGAVILFSEDKNLYPLVETSFEGYDNTRRCQSPISARGARNIAITGHGVIDGNGEYWRPLKQEKAPSGVWRRVTARGGVYKRPTYWFPSAQALRGDSVSDMNVPRHFTTEAEWASVKDFLRPVMVSLIDCDNILLQGVIFQNSPAWNIHPLKCRNLIVDRITVRNPSYAQNGDGLDIESCSNVLVLDSQFDVGDDGICLKSGKDADGRRRARPTENVVVEGCTVFAGHGGFVVGSEMSGGVRNVAVSRCQFVGTDVGLRFKSRRGRGGVVENIYVSDVTMTDIATEPLLFNLFYGGKSAVETLEAGGGERAAAEVPAVDETTPVFRSIHIDGLVCRNARRALYFNGIPEMPISDITLRNMTVSARLGGEMTYCEGIKFDNVKIDVAEGEKLILHSCTNVSGEVETTD